MTKKILAVLLALAMTMSLFSFNVFAAENDFDAKVYLYISDINSVANVAVTSYNQEYTVTYEGNARNISSAGDNYISLKSSAEHIWDGTASSIPEGTIVKVTKLFTTDASGSEKTHTFDGGQATYSEPVKAEGKLEVDIYNTYGGASIKHGDELPESATKVSVTFVLVDPNAKEDPEPDTGKHPKGEEKLDLSEVEFPFNGPDRHVFPINPLEGGDTIKVHVVGSSESDFRFYLVGDNDIADSNAVKASDLNFTTGDFDLTFDLTVNDGKSVKNLQVKGATFGASVTNLKFTHIGVVYPASEQTGDHPEGEKVVEITDATVSKLGTNEVVIADGTVTSSAEQFAIKIPEIANLNDKITVHIKGTTSGDFRMWAGHDDGAITMSPEPLWKASEKGVEFPTPDGEEFDVTYTLVVADKDGRGCKEADCVIFKGASYGANLDNLKITHFGYTIEKFVPEVPEPKGYVSDAALNVEPVADDDANALVVTPSEEVKTEGVLVAFADGAPDDGNIVVNYVDDTPPKSPCGPNDIEVFFEPEGKSFPDCTMPWDFVGCGGLWGKTYASNAFNITIEKLKEVFGKEGATFTYAFTGTPGWTNEGVPSAVLNGKFDAADSLPIETETKGNLTIGTFTLADLVKKSGVAVDAIENFVIQTSTDNFKLVYAYFTVPNEVVNPNAGKDAPAASTEPVEFKTGDKYVEISTDAKKVIDSIVITYNGKTVALDPSAIDYIKIKSEDNNWFAGVDGYAIQLGPDYHGFFFMGRLITMPHTFDENNTCTACDFVKPASEGDETVVDVPAKPDIITIDQGGACVIDIQSLGLKAGDTVHISIAGTVKTSVEAVRIFLTKEGVFNNNASDIVTATLDGNSFTFEGDLVAQGDIFYIYLKSQAGGPALHPNSFDFTVFTAEKV